MYGPRAAKERRARAASFRATWDQRAPDAETACCADVEQTLASLTVDVPEALSPLLRTANLLGRFPREARRPPRDLGIVQREHGCEVVWSLRVMRETAQQHALLTCHRG